MKCSSCNHDMIINPFNVASCPNCFNVHFVNVEQKDSTNNNDKKYDDLMVEHQRLIKLNQHMLNEIESLKNNASKDLETINYVRELLTASSTENNLLKQQINSHTNDSLHKYIKIQDDVLSECYSN